MTKGTIGPILCASTALLVGYALPATARQADEGARRSAAPHSSFEDGAAPATDGDIVVTARRVEERLQDVPISMTVFSQAQLDNRNITNGADLAVYTPSLTATQRFGSNNTSFAIRGFVQEQRTTPSVGVYFADVVAPRGGGAISAGDGAGAGSFFDLRNVQVLKGPQGTLFGRNTTGGAVLLVPNDATSEFEGYLEGSYGNFEMKRIQGVLNIPFSEAIRFRVGGDAMRRDGYLRNLSGIGPDRFGNVNYYALRATLELDLAPGLENTTILSTSRSKNNGAVEKLTDCTNLFPFGLLACQQVARQAGQGFYVNQNNLPDPRSLARQWQVINRTDWQASDNLTIRNIVSYAELRNETRVEVFGTSFLIPRQFGPIADTGALAGLRATFANSSSPKGQPNAHQSTFTEELQFIGSAFDNRLSWQAGAYMERSRPLSESGQLSPILMSCPDQDAFRCTDVFGTILGIPGLGSLISSFGTMRYDNYGLYGQATYSLRDNLKFTAGLRHTWDRVEASNKYATYRFLQPNVPIGFCTFPGVGPVGGGPIADTEQCRARTVVKSQAPTWVVGLDYNPAEDVLLYGKYSRGYRQGTVNPFAPPPFQTVEPEQVDTYELGAKTAFRGAVSGTFNLAAFYNNFQDQQVAVGLLSSANAATPTQAIVNAGRSRIWGIEAEASVRPFERFNLSGSLAYLNTKVTDIIIPVAAPGSVYDIIQPSAVKGSRLALTPRYKATATASYELPLSESLGRMTASATYSYTGKQIFALTARGTLDAYDFLNLNLDWAGIGGSPFDAAVFVINATGKKYYLSVSDNTRQGFISQLPAEPRTYGLRLRWRFGN
ncbi:TonB-dependent receptor [Novosphingobium sp. M1R2S20]|uniref:TonB-dependent receptor n=1 Tax=Novosphingobium rhizovicinum TaxID=3228928 RepID=A0ABV3RD61_9SPHN